MNDKDSFSPTLNNKWLEMHDSVLPHGASFNVQNFKSSSVNYKIALWNPETSGIRWLKTLIFNITSQLSDEDLKRISSIKNRSVGNPIEVRQRGVAVCLDYFQSYLEAKFIEDLCPLSGASVLEIGAGYGRTCHTLLSLHNQIKRYVILDIPWMLEIAETYLRKVLTDDQFSKVTFVSLEDFDRISHESFTLILNINGFNDFDGQVVYGYLQHIRDHARWFYTKNPVCKYDISEIDGRIKLDREIRQAIETGIMLDIVDIFDSEEVQSKVPDYLSRFCPGPDWKCVRAARAEPWSFYYQALYELRA